MKSTIINGITWGIILTILIIVLSCGSEKDPEPEGICVYIHRKSVNAQVPGYNEFIKCDDWINIGKYGDKYIVERCSC